MTQKKLNNNKIRIKFLVRNLETGKLFWSKEKIIMATCISSLDDSQIKRVVEFKDGKIIFFDHNSHLSVIAICLFDN